MNAAQASSRRGSLALLAVVTLASLLWTAPRWLQDPTFSFGVLVWAWVLWVTVRRADHGRLDPWTALAALGLTVVAWRTQFPFHAALAFMAAVAHVSLRAGTLRGAWIPLLVIPLTVPPPGFEHLLVALQVVVAWATEAALALVGIASTRDALALHTQDNTYFIAPLCTGLSSVLSVLALLAIAAWHLRVPPRRTAAVLAAGLALTVILNVARIVVLVVATERWGPRFIEGATHEAVGLALSLVAVLALLPFLQRRKQSPNTPGGAR